MNFHNTTQRFIRVRPMDDVRIALSTPAFLPQALQKPELKRRSFGWGNVFLLAFIYSLFFTTTGYTISYFNDLDHSIGNSVSAGRLDLNVSSEGSLDNRFSVEGGSNALVTFSASSSIGDFATQYGVAAEKVSGSDALCALVNAFSPTGAPFVYDGPLLALATASTTNFTPWPLLFTIAGDTSNIVQDETCSVDLVYRGSIVGALPGTGYQDIERISLVFTADVPAQVEQILLESFSVVNEEEEQEEIPPPPPPLDEPPATEEVPPVDEPVEPPPPDDEKKKEDKPQEEKPKEEKQEKEEKKAPDTPAEEPGPETPAEEQTPPPPPLETVQEETDGPDIPTEL